MLTPVRAASNASFSSQGQTAAIVASGLGHSAIAPAPVNAVEAADLNSAIAGKLNILLLAARERMVEALFDVIDAAGRSISLDRGEDESNLAFASRLADAIRRLPAARIDEVERQLTAQGHGLPLRTIAEALKNPTGPEAARIVAYLEIVRYKDRDLAARAVVRSYRQNDASPMRAEARPEIQLHEDNRPAAATRQPAEKVPVLVAPLTEAAALVTAEEPLIAETVEAADPETPQPEEAPAQPAPVAAAEVAAEESLPQEIEARQLLSTDLDKIEDTQEAVEQSAVQPRIVSDKADPVIPRNWAGIVASMTEEVSEMIATLIREQEIETVLEDVPVEAAVEIDTILDEAVISEATGSLTKQPVELAAPDVRQTSSAPPVADGYPALGCRDPPAERNLRPSGNDTAPRDDRILLCAAGGKNAGGTCLHPAALSVRQGYTVERKGRRNAPPAPAPSRRRPTGSESGRAAGAVRRRGCRARRRRDRRSTRAEDAEDDRCRTGGSSAGRRGRRPGLCPLSANGRLGIKQFQEKCEAVFRPEIA